MDRTDCRVRHPLWFDTAAKIMSWWTSRPANRTPFILVFLSLNLGWLLHHSNRSLLERGALL